MNSMEVECEVQWYCVRCWESGVAMVDEIERDHRKHSTRCALRPEALSDLRFVLASAVQRVREAKRA